MTKLSTNSDLRIHPALNQNKINIQSKNIVSVAAMFDNNVLQFTDREDTNLYNILTGCLFKSNVEEIFYPFILKENDSAKNLLMKGFGESQQSAFGLH